MKTLVLFMISVYQKALSPLLGQRCRFYPSCSEYARLTFEKNHFVKAFTMTLWRVLRCQPLSRGGFDYP